MRSLHSVILATCARLASAQGEYAGGCPEAQIIRNGFDVTFWQYALYSQAGFLPNGSMNPIFYEGGYKDGILLTDQVQGLTDINFFSLEPEDPILEYGEVYGRKTSITNFTLEFVGYYKAPQDGEYTLYLSADDNVSLQFGRGNSCCGSFDSNLIVDRFETGTSGVSYEYGIQNIEGATFRTSNFTTVLSKGIYYPIKMVYFNAVGPRALLTTMVEPDGTNNTLWAKDVYQMNVTECPLIVSEPWTGSFTTDTTTTISAPSITTTEIIVRTPGGTGIETTTTVPWTGASTQTKTSTGLYTTTVDGFTHTGIVTTYWVDTPTTPIAPAIASTVTSPWTGTDVSAHTRTEPYTLNGETGIITRVWVLTPAAPDTTTTPTPTGPSLYSYTQTGPYTTTLGTHTDTGVDTPDEVVVPTAPGSATTITQPWTGLSTRTRTSIGYYTTTAAGSTHTGSFTTYWVETPTTPTAPAIASTMTFPWTGTDVSAHTRTEPYTLNGETGIITRVWVLTPAAPDTTTTPTPTGPSLPDEVVIPTAPGSATTITQPWTGLSTRTRTSIGYYTTTADGSTHTGSFTTYWVETPTTPTAPAIASTMTFPWTGTDVSAHTKTEPYTLNGETGIMTRVWVLTPAAPDTTTTLTPTGPSLYSYTQTGPYTTTLGTHTDTGVDTSDEVVVSMAPGSATTITQPWAGLSTQTRTSTGYYSTTADGSTHTGSFTIYWVETPTTPTAPAIASTMTFPWTGTDVSAHTRTEPYTLNGETGIITRVRLLTPAAPDTTTTPTPTGPSLPDEVVIPTAPGTATTVRQPWTGTFKRTISTEVGPYTITSDGLRMTGEATTIYVETPEMKTITSEWTGTTTKTATIRQAHTVTSNSQTLAYSVRVVLIETPMATLSSTTEPWSGTFTSTFTTETPVTVTNLLTETSSIVVIETPTADLSTTTVPWTGSFTSTFTTETPVTVTSGTNVLTESSSIVVVETPTADLSTTTVPWTGSFTSTFTTETPVTLTSGTNVLTKSSSIVVVETPTTDLSTTTVPWTGSFTSTFTTETPVTVTSGTNVLTEPSSIVVVETPTADLSTTTVPWTGSFTSTFTTETPVTVTSGTNVLTAPSSIVVVETPTADLSTTTVPWTGSFTSTFTTETPRTGTSGTLVYTSLSSIVVVETPFSIMSISVPGTVIRELPKDIDSDTTKPWTGSTTSTFTTETSVTRTAGNLTFATASSVVVVETLPTANLSTTTVPWSGTFTSTIPTTTLVTESSGTDTLVIPTSIVVVETPLTDLRTVTVPWTGTFTSTFTTETKSTMTSGTSVFTTSESIVVVETPSGSTPNWSSPSRLNTIPVETKTSTWAETFSSTYSTAIISSANKTITYVVVEVPSCTECAGNQLSRSWPKQSSGEPMVSSAVREPLPKTAHSPNDYTGVGGTYTATREVTLTTMESCTLEKCHPVSIADQGSKTLASSREGERPSPPSSTDNIPRPSNNQPAQPSAFYSSCSSCSTDTFSANPSGSPNKPFDDSQGSSSSQRGSTSDTPQENPAGEQSNQKPVETSDSFNNYPENSSGSFGSSMGASEDSSQPTSSGINVVDQNPESTSIAPVAVANKGSHLSSRKASSAIFGLLMLMLI